MIINRALRDEGTSYHYAAPKPFADANPALVTTASDALGREGLHAYVGSSWTTNAPFRETADAVEAARMKDFFAVKMEAAAFYTFARSRGAAVPRPCHQHNGQTEKDIEKGALDGTTDALRLLAAIVRGLTRIPMIASV